MGNEEPKRVLFSLGRIVATPGAMAAMETHGITGFELLARHAFGDWGCVDEQDARENDKSVKYDFRILSAYPLDASKPCDRDNKLWIITEADRSSTCIMLPDDY